MDRKTLEKAKKQLKRLALMRFTKIYPIIHKRSLKKCYTIESIKDKTFLIFWYNDQSGSTHIEKKLI